MDKPKENEVYMLIGGADDKCISNGNTWEESIINAIKQSTRRVEEILNEEK